MLVGQASGLGGALGELVTADAGLEELTQPQEAFPHGGLLEEVLHPAHTGVTKLQAQALVCRRVEVELPGETIKGFVHCDLLDYGLHRPAFHLPTGEVPKHLPNQRSPEVNARVLPCERREIGEGLVKNHREERDQAKHRSHLKRSFEEIPLVHRTPDVWLT
jgi:hypothetical protein